MKRLRSSSEIVFCTINAVDDISSNILSLIKSIASITQFSHDINLCSMICLIVRFNEHSANFDFENAK